VNCLKMAGGMRSSFDGLQRRFMQVCESEMCLDMFVCVCVVCRASLSVFLTNVQ
jgi:hypothetical protein